MRENHHGSKIETLDLRNNKIEDTAILEHLVPILAASCGGLHCKLSHIIVRDPDELVARTSQGNKPKDYRSIITNLKKLDLSHNCISDFTGEKIALILKHNTELQSLDLKKN